MAKLTRFTWGLLGNSHLSHKILFSRMASIHTGVGFRTQRDGCSYQPCVDGTDKRASAIFGAGVHHLQLASADVGQGLPGFSSRCPAAPEYRWHFSCADISPCTLPVTRCSEVLGVHVERCCHS